MGPKWLLCAIAALVFLSDTVHSARILSILPTISRSHHIWNRALTLALAKRGHQMTVLSPDPEKEPVPNLKHYNLEDSYQLIQDAFDLEGMIHDTSFDMVAEIWKWGLISCKHQIQTKGAKDLLKLPPDSFDLIIVELVFNECMFMYLHHFGGGTRIPVVGVTAFGMGPWTDIATGGRTMPSVFAFPTTPYLSKMNLWERLHNTLVTGLYWGGMHYHYLSAHHKIAEEAYGKPLPPLAELVSNVSVALVNNHYAISGPQAQLPGVVDVGGMQCGSLNPLPKDIQDFLDGSKKGAVLFSLGSNLRSENLPKEKLQAIVSTFAALGPDIRFVWKFDPKIPIEGLPSNVLLKKWIPQEDILAHPKVLAFVTHAGLLSTHEAIYHAKPMVGVPFFADQHTNMKRILDMQIGNHVDFLTMTAESFTKAIKDVVSNQSYQRNVHKISSIFRDQPESPLDRAIFWVEYALRHDTGGVKSLRSASSDLAWYQYFLVDVIVIIVTGISLALLIPILMLRAIYKKIMKTSEKKSSREKSKKKQ